LNFFSKLSVNIFTVFRKLALIQRELCLRAMLLMDSLKTISFEISSSSDEMKTGLSFLKPGSSMDFTSAVRNVAPHGVKKY